MMHQLYVCYTQVACQLCLLACYMQDVACGDGARHGRKGHKGFSGNLHLVPLTRDRRWTCLLQIALGFSV